MTLRRRRRKAMSSQEVHDNLKEETAKILEIVGKA